MHRRVQDIPFKRDKQFLHGVGRVWFDIVVRQAHFLWKHTLTSYLCHQMQFLPHYKPQTKFFPRQRTTPHISDLAGYCIDIFHKMCCHIDSSELTDLELEVTYYRYYRCLSKCKWYRYYILCLETDRPIVNDEWGWQLTFLTYWHVEYSCDLNLQT